MRAFREERGQAKATRAYATACYEYASGRHCNNGSRAGGHAQQAGQAGPSCAASTSRCDAAGTCQCNRAQRRTAWEHLSAPGVTRLLQLLQWLETVPMGVLVGCVCTGQLANNATAFPSMAKAHKARAPLVLTSPIIAQAVNKSVDEVRLAL